MKKSATKLDIHKDFKKAAHLYNDMLEEFKPETIHDFRLEMKKLRAFMRLLNKSDVSDKPIKLSAELRECYHIAGNIRNLQLQRQRIVELSQDLELTPPLYYLNLLWKQETIEKQKCRDAAKKVSLKDIDEDAVSHIHHKLNDKAVSDYLADKRKILEAYFLLPFLSDEDLHSLRKMLKDLLYNWIYIASHLNLLPDFFTHKKNIEVLATSLGDFHDLCMAGCFLSEEYLTAIKEEEKAVCYLCRRYFEKEKTYLKQVIISTLCQAANKEDKNEILFEAYSK